MTQSKLQKVQRAGLITIPKQLREAAKIQEGDYVEVQLVKDGLLVRLVDIRRNYRNPTEKENPDND